MSTSTESILEVEGSMIELDDLTKSKSGKPEEQLHNKSKDQLAANKNYTTTSLADNGYDKTITPEIWHQALSYLDTKALKNFRLCSNRFAILGSEHFIQTFAFRFDRLDLEKLEMISREHPRTLKSVKEIKFEKGFVPIRAMLGVLHKEYRDAFEWDAEGRYILEQNVEIEPIGISDILSEYLAWYTSWNKAAQNYDDITRMTKAFKDLNNATCIRFSTGIPNFKSEALARAWAKVTLPRAYGGLWKTRELETVMLAAQNSKVKLRRFVHDAVPTIFFLQDLNRLENTLKSFRDLDSLELLCDRKHSPIRGEITKRFWIGLWKAAQLAPNLETLHLGLVTGGYCNFETYEYAPLRKVLGDFTWPSLTRLRLDNMSLCEKDLTNFLLRHASSLRHLTLTHIYLFRGSFQGLFQALRQGLKLESFHVDGLMHSSFGRELWHFFSTNKEVVESPELTEAENLRERLLTEAKLQFYKDNQDKYPGRLWLRMQEDGLADELSARLSAFVLKKCDITDWPGGLINKLAEKISYDGRVSEWNGWTEEQIDAVWDFELEEELLDTHAGTWAEFQDELPQHIQWLRDDWSWKSEWSYPSSKWALWDELEEQAGVRALYENSYA
ncbi:hypothetical protein BOTCAL_0242g00020 [Botryotinia calthae]|uniref:F-box domain-containing protein n=1 Tax=Botryotinia calthae TaxID=38488 RepID=A0A4Y8CXL7_9HELO|nr:hypothetical protein BOTCAL_0242g00020 [Botryotinia calthae]